MAKVQKFGWGGMYGGTRAKQANQQPQRGTQPPSMDRMRPSPLGLPMPSSPAVDYASSNPNTGVLGRPIAGLGGQGIQQATDLSGMSAADIQRLNQMQGMLQGSPVGGATRQVMQPQAVPMQIAAQMPTAQTNATQAAPSFANQLGGLGTTGLGLQQLMANKPAGMKKGGVVKKKTKKMASGGKVSSASKRADGCAIKGKTRGKMV
jgi:hypothetical protein